MYKDCICTIFNQTLELTRSTDIESHVLRCGPDLYLSVFWEPKHGWWRHKWLVENCTVSDAFFYGNNSVIYYFGFHPILQQTSHIYTHTQIVSLFIASTLQTTEDIFQVSNVYLSVNTVLVVCVCLLFEHILKMFQKKKVNIIIFVYQTLHPWSLLPPPVVFCSPASALSCLQLWSTFQLIC